MDDVDIEFSPDEMRTLAKAMRKALTEGHYPPAERKFLEEFLRETEDALEDGAPSLTVVVGS